MLGRNKSESREVTEPAPRFVCLGSAAAMPPPGVRANAEKGEQLRMCRMSG